MEDKRVRGIYVSSAHDFYVRGNGYSREQVATIEAQLSPDLKAALPTIEQSKWYPLHYATDQLRGIYQAHEDPQVAIETIEKCGRYIGDQATSTFMRLVLKMMTLPLLASKWQQFWGKYNDFGICVADASQIKDKKFFVTANPGYPYVHGIGAGWLQNVFKALGKTNVKVTTNVPLGVVELPEVIWTTTWE